MAQLPLSLIVTVSVSAIPAGIGLFNVNNCILFTAETPLTTSGLGWDAFESAEDVVTAYGSGAQTSALAIAVFAQSPNILAGGGQLIIAPLLTDLGAVTAVQTVTIGGTPASGTFVLSFNGNPTTSLDYNIDAADMQTALRLLAGLSTATVALSGEVYTVTFTGFTGPAPLLVVSSNSVENSGSVVLPITVATTVIGVAAGTERLLAAIVRLQPLVSFCGVMKENAYVAASSTTQSELLVAADYVQTQNLILVVASNTAGDATASTGIMWQVMDAGLNQTRCVQYLLDGTYNTANLMAAAYMGRGFSTAFDGSNTTQNMQLKQLSTILADANMTLTQYEVCQAAGVDVYPSVQGYPCVLTSGANKFFDQVYNLMWLKTSIQVEVFNAMAETPTKIPQTEAGMSQLKSAVQGVYQQGTVNGYLAPGTWSGGTFGSQADFLRNISTVGYYIYSSPVATQSQTARNARVAPLIQSAGKEAGGINSASISVQIQA